MLKAIGAAVVFVLIVVGAIACVIWYLSPKVRDTTKEEIEAWRNSETGSTANPPPQQEPLE
jgi:hypothetical protein